MNKKLLVLILLIPLSVLAQCSPEDAPWIDGLLASIYDVFGDKLLKIFSCLYGISLLFKIMSLSLSKVVLITTWTDRDDALVRSLNSHKWYKFLSFIADLFLRLKLPGRKK